MKAILMPNCMHESADPRLPLGFVHKEDAEDAEPLPVKML
jgi:hypothetical protein